MKNLIVYERAKQEANYIIDKKSTIRDTANVFNVSKSTVHRDVTDVLSQYHDPLELKCSEVLQNNSAEKHIRGGEATKQKYLKYKI